MNDVPIDLRGSYVDLVVKSDIKSATECHREARLFCVEIGDTKNRPQVRAVDIDLLISEAKQRVAERFQASIRGVVFEL
jgi:hypothetical protein